MPRRLLVAAEIIRDTASSQKGALRAELETLARKLEAHAAEIAQSRGVELHGLAHMDSLLTSIRQIASAVDPEAPPLPPDREIRR